jgi:hypothetical protein
MDMETEEENIFERLESAANRLEQAVRTLDEQRSQMAGNLERISATVEPSQREADLAAKLAEGQVDVRKLDAALAGLSLEQRIAVKSQLLRAGAIA